MNRNYYNMMKQKVFIGFEVDNHVYEYIGYNMNKRVERLANLVKIIATPG